VIGYLNTQTAFLGSIVVGNGINYGLIYLGRVQQLRRRGDPLVSSCVEGAVNHRARHPARLRGHQRFLRRLMIAANRGFRHFGFIGGIGMLLCWAFTFTLVPALLAIYERFRGAPRIKPEPSGERYIPTLQRFFNRPRLIIAIFAGLSVAAAISFGLQLKRGAMERTWKTSPTS